MDKYRLHPSCLEHTKNSVSKRQVINIVLKQQLVQVAMVAIVFKVTGGTKASPTAPTTWYKLAWQVTVAMIFFDLWQYAWHRALHANRFLYRNLHSWHHDCLVVPYAFGALYRHPVKGFFADTVGSMAAFLVSGMSPRTSIFFSLCTVKVIENHCRLSLLPHWDRRSFWNNAAYHDVHHQLHGGRYNYSQLFFVVWDRVFGTYTPFVIENRDRGGMLVKAPGLDYRSKK